MTGQPRTGASFGALSLGERVRSCVPLRHPAYGQLLQLLSIEESHAVPTAAVTIGARSRFLINPRFAAEHCRTEEHLSMLVMHELYHVLLGHTRLYRRSTLRANWAFDCIINAQLCRLHPSPAYTSFFAGLAASEGPWSLIGPPNGWPEAPRYASDPLGHVHQRLYEDDGVTTAELFALLDNLEVALGPQDEAERRLLGSHRNDDDPPPCDADPALAGEVRRIVARWPMVERRGGADDGGDPRDERVALESCLAVRHSIARILRAAADVEAGARRTKREEAVAAYVARPQAGDRRAFLWRSQGGTPLLWQGAVNRSSLASAGRATVYLDVSGSVATKLPVLLDAVRANARLVKWPVLGFSTQVHPLTRQEVADGSFRSTDGTNIACVTRHILEKQIRRAVIVTDGDVLAVPSADIEELCRRRPSVWVGITEGGNSYFADTLGWRSISLPAFP